MLFNFYTRPLQRFGYANQQQWLSQVKKKPFALHAPDCVASSFSFDCSASPDESSGRMKQYEAMRKDGVDYIAYKHNRAAIFAIGPGLVKKNQVTSVRSSHPIEWDWQFSKV